MLQCKLILNTYYQFIQVMYKTTYSYIKVIDKFLLNSRLHDRNKTPLGSKAYVSYFHSFIIYC